MQLVFSYPSKGSPVLKWGRTFRNQHANNVNLGSRVHICCRLQHGRVIRAPDLKSGDREFKSRSDLKLIEVVSW